jgi:hypothetical protein
VWRSLVAHSLWERGAVGSNPATPTVCDLHEHSLGGADTWARIVDALGVAGKAARASYSPVIDRHQRLLGCDVDLHRAVL